MSTLRYSATLAAICFILCIVEHAAGEHRFDDISRYGHDTSHTLAQYLPSTSVIHPHSDLSQSFKGARGQAKVLDLIGYHWKPPSAFKVLASLGAPSGWDRRWSWSDGRLYIFQRRNGTLCKALLRCTLKFNRTDLSSHLPTLSSLNSIAHYQLNPYHPRCSSHPLAILNTTTWFIRIWVFAAGHSISIETRI
ncbi:hypothetical protein F5Y18DRAFT_340173 [Xylariaceae sp. FL1019]|nr:hypothetical protein F5Y18DRAFT_340173 [Xylariaceae sp. FL1019]